MLSSLLTLGLLTAPLRPACRPACTHRASASPEPGKFVRHNELSPGCAPLGVLCGGFDEEQLEAIAEAIESVFDGPDGQVAHIPIVPLAQDDMRVKLRDVLAKLPDRDSVIPEQPIRLGVPLVLLSGFSPVQTSLAVRSVRALGLRGKAQPSFRWPWESADAGEELRPPMFAAAVPKALDKPLSILCEELEGDARANAR